MHTIPWLVSIEELPTLELWVLALGVTAGCFATGLTLDVILRENGLGTAANGVLTMVGLFLGIYLRYRLFDSYSAYDGYLTTSVAFATASVLLFTLCFIKSRLN
jgi:hypothetical protein